MTSATSLVSVEEYLRTNYRPNAEYLDGIVRPKAFGTRSHSHLQFRVALIVHERFHSFLPYTELTLKISERRYRVPDVAVIPKREGARPHLCIDLLSPEERIEKVVEEAHEYLEWGVPTVWILDPEASRAWQLDSSGFAEAPVDGALRAGEIAISVQDIFG